METDGNGHYWRDRRGVWRYTLSGEPVPGARPRHRWDASHPFPRVDLEGARYVAVPAADLAADGELAYLASHPAAVAECVAGRKRPVRYLIPEYLWPADEDPAGGMWAPELSRELLVSTHELARVLGYSTLDTVWPMLSKGLLPAPVVRYGRRQYWTRPVLAAWQAIRGPQIAAVKAAGLARITACSKAAAARRAAARAARGG